MYGFNYLNMLKRYSISVSEFDQCLNTTLTPLISEEQINQVLPLLRREFCFCIISESPENPMIECAELAPVLMAHGIEADMYLLIKQRFYKFYLKPHVQIIDEITTHWREHIDVELTWGYNHDNSMIDIHFTAKPLKVDLERELTAMIDKIVEDNGFIPYKFLRVIGRL